MSIGQNVKRLRQEKKLSPDLIAKKVGKGGRQWVYDLEKGKIKRLTEEDIGLLAEALSVTVNDLREIPSIPGLTSVKPFTFFTPKIEHDLSDLKGFREKYYYLIEENRLLWKENAYLKSLLIKHQIDVYDTDNQNDTV